MPTTAMERPAGDRREQGKRDGHLGDGHGKREKDDGRVGAGAVPNITDCSPRKETCHATGLMEGWVD